MNASIPPASKTTIPVSFEKFPVQETVAGGTAFQQKIIGSFDAATNNFSLDDFLKPDTGSVLREQALNYLLAEQRGIIHYGDFFNQLPNVLVENPVKPSFSQLSFSQGAISAVGNLLERGSQAPINEKVWQKLLERYGQNGEDIVKLAADLIDKNPQADISVQREVLGLMHGDLRTEAFLEMMDLKRISHQDPQNWGNELERLISPDRLTERQRDVLIAGKQEILRQQIYGFLETKKDIDVWLKRRGLRRSDVEKDTVIAKDGERFDLKNREDAEIFFNKYIAVKGGSIDYRELYAKDFYRILGVDEDVSSDDIKLAYRKLAKQYHPDLNKDSKAEGRMKEINSAYEVLGDKGKRREYDEFRREEKRSSSSRRQPPQRKAKHQEERSGFSKNVKRQPIDSVDMLRRVFFEYGKVPVNDFGIIKKGAGKGWYYFTDINGNRIFVDPQKPEEAVKILDELRRQQPHIYQYFNPDQPEKSSEEPFQDAGLKRERYAKGNIAGATDIGLKRQNNEDTFYISSSTNVFSVFDGVGGGDKGEVASNKAREIISRGGQSLKEAVELANREIHSMNRERIKKIIREGGHINEDNPPVMATTVTAALIKNDILNIVHVGDSRAYLVHGGKIEQLTRDHVSQYNENQLTRAVGRDPDVEVDVYSRKLSSGDIVILSTDGLTKYFSPQEIFAVVTTFPPQEAVDKFIEWSNARGGKDNITVVVKRV